MNWILKWMREQMSKRKSAWEEESVADKVTAEKHIGTWNMALRILDEAEAKLETEVCEWQYNYAKYCYETSCVPLRFVTMRGTPIQNEFKHCPYCGRKIRVVE